MKRVIYLLALLCSVYFTSAATIYGNIYDISLNRMENVIVDISTEPKQLYVSKNGTYVFEVPIGDYTIEAKHYVSNILESSVMENISVKNDGMFILDLILFPVIDSELIEGINRIDLEDDYFKEKNLFSIIIIVAIVILLLFIYLVKKRKKLTLFSSVVKYFIPYTPSKIDNKKKKKESEDYLDMVLGLIKKEGRITQKDIRKQVPLSEAKISLIITELENDGIIKKIKKGRGNIIILKTTKFH